MNAESEQIREKLRRNLKENINVNNLRKGKKPRMNFVKNYMKDMKDIEK